MKNKSMKFVCIKDVNDVNNCMNMVYPFGQSDYKTILNYPYKSVDELKWMLERMVLSVGGSYDIYDVDFVTADDFNFSEYDYIVPVYVVEE